MNSGNVYNSFHSVQTNAAAITKALFNDYIMWNYILGVDSFFVGIFMAYSTT
jgi:hypothetical protein